MKRFFLIWLMMICGMVSTMAQGFYNLTAEEVKIDSLLPFVNYSWPLGGNYADSTYEVRIAYPEFLDMAEEDVNRYHAITTEHLPELPRIQQYVGVSRKSGTLYAQFVPLVFREGKYQKLVSFQLQVKSAPAGKTRRASSSGDRYAAHSVLSSGHWAKIRVPETGFYHLTDALIRKAGFKNPKKVKIYGYGGELQPEVLTGEYLSETDDLKEVATCTIKGKRLFHASGPVSWASNTTLARTRNPYSDYGYYFLTESDDEPLTADSASFVPARNSRLALTVTSLCLAFIPRRRR